MTALPAGGAELAAICDALGLKTTAQQEGALLAYLDLLQRWNATYNLTAVRDRSAMLGQHLADCLAVVAPLGRQLPVGQVLDVGSGGGLPGVVLACLLPALTVTCVDTVGKKAAFIRQCAAVLALGNLRASHARVESLAVAAFDVVTSRAFASLATFTQLTERLLTAEGVWMAMKGRTPHQEMAELSPHIEVFHVEPLTVPGLDAQRCLVWMRRRAPR